jgi:hypothetical protein
MTHLEFRFRFVTGSEESTELKGAESESGEEESIPVRDEVESLVIVRVGSLTEIGEIFGETVHCVERRGKERFRNGLGKCRSFQRETEWRICTEKLVELFCEEDSRREKKCIYKL